MTSIFTIATLEGFIDKGLLTLLKKLKKIKKAREGD